MDPVNLSSLPIGIFDSGFGGLTVMKAIKRTLPNEKIIYLGDVARLPYGNKSPSKIQEISFENIQFLINKGVKAVVIACHTASSTALDSLKTQFSIPIIGVIEPCLQAFKNHDQLNIVILGTKATINTQIYETKLKKINPNFICTSIPCPLFVPLVEEGFSTGTLAKEVIKTYLRNLKKNNPHKVILACTHYPLLKDELQNYLGALFEMIDPAESCAQYLKTRLIEAKLVNNLDTENISEFFATDDPVKFKLLGEKFLGSKIDHVNLVKI